MRLVDLAVQVELLVALLGAQEAAEREAAVERVAVVEHLAVDVRELHVEPRRVRAERLVVVRLVLAEPVREPRHLDRRLVQRLVRVRGQVPLGQLHVGLADIGAHVEAVDAVVQEARAGLGRRAVAQTVAASDTAGRLGSSAFVVS